MKNLLIAFFLVCGLAYSSSMSAQIAINNTTETWIVSFQNADTPCPPGITIFTIGPVPTAGRGVLQASNPNFCNNKFQGSGFWNAPCSLLTNSVQYIAPAATLPPTPAIFIFN